MVDGLHIPIWNRTKEVLAIDLSRVGKRVKGRDDGAINNVQDKSNWIATTNPLLYNEYSLIKIFFKKLVSWFGECSNKYTFPIY
jgi:hypothetical protein